MTHETDYTALDRPEFLQFVFYPRKGFTGPPPGATDHLIPVDKDVSVSCRFYVRDLDSPSVLFFHGYSEIACDYDSIAPMYLSRGMNLFVADYRGYGSSGGTPAFSSMVADAHHIFEGFWELLRRHGYTGKVFVMGRSLGSVPAIELASHYGEKIAGLIIDCGFASTIRLMTLMGFPRESLGIKDFGFPNLSKIRTVSLPTLVLHGEFDNLIPLAEGQDLFDNVATEEKRLVIIPEALHNDMVIRNKDLYFGAIEDLVFGP